MWDLILEFLIEFLKIFGVIIGLSFAVSFLQTFIPFKRFLEKTFRKNNIISLIFAVGLGFLSPFCSCTIIPVVIILLQTGAPLSLTLAFFTSAALLNITSLIALFTLMPVNFVLMYMGFAVLLCVILYLVFIKRKNYKRKNAFAALETNSTIADASCHCKCAHCGHDEHEEHEETIEEHFDAKEHLEETEAKKKKRHKHHKAYDMQAEDCKTFKSKVIFALKRTRDILADTWIFLLIALIISFTITQLLTEEFLKSAVNDNLALTNVLLNVFGGVLHGEIVALIPVLELFSKAGLPYITIIAFLGTSAVISIPLSITLAKYIKVKDIIIYNLAVFVYYLFLSFIFMLF